MTSTRDTGAWNLELGAWHLLSLHHLSRDEHINCYRWSSSAALFGMDMTLVPFQLRYHCFSFFLIIGCWREEPMPHHQLWYLSAKSSSIMTFTSFGLMKLDVSFPETKIHKVTRYATDNYCHSDVLMCCGHCPSHFGVSCLVDGFYWTLISIRINQCTIWWVCLNKKRTFTDANHALASVWMWVRFGEFMTSLVSQCVLF